MEKINIQLPKNRIFYLYLGLIVILLSSAVIFTTLHEKGYRIKGFSIQKTGTLIMEISEPDTWIFLGEDALRKTVGESEKLNIPNINPGMKLVTVIKNEYFPWAKKIEIPSGEKLVLYPFLLKQDVEAEKISATHPDFLKVIRGFQNFSPQMKYETGINNVSIQENQILIKCLEKKCEDSSITLESPINEIYMFRKNPNVVVYSTPTEIHVSELSADLRISYKIFEGQNIRFYPENDNLYVQSAGLYYKISF